MPSLEARLLCASFSALFDQDVEAHALLRGLGPKFQSEAVGFLFRMESLCELLASIVESSTRQQEGI